MTAFITHYWRSSRAEARRLLLGLWLACAGLSVAWAEPGAEVSSLRVERSAEALRLSASVRFELPAAVEDALRKGVPLFFVIEADIFRERWYWTDKKVMSAARQMRLLFHPLTQRWRLGMTAADNSGGAAGALLNRNFDTLGEALGAVQRTTGWRIGEAAEIESDARYRVEFRFRLDVSQLPRPLQIGVLGQTDWNIAASVTQKLILESAP